MNFVVLHFFASPSCFKNILQSVVSEWKVNALDASFIHAPVGEDLAWRLTATIAPCHVTVISFAIIHVDSYHQMRKILYLSCMFMLYQNIFESSLIFHHLVSYS